MKRDDINNWIIVRKSDHRQWGVEEYVTREDAEAELRSFWKDVPKARSVIEKFEIVRRSEQSPVGQLAS